MRIFVPKETGNGSDETRVSLIPPSVKRLCGLGAQISVESGLGETLGLTDADYENAGAMIETNRGSGFEQAELVLRMHKPSIEDLKAMKANTIQLSYLDPFNESDLLKALAESGVSAISVEMIPRTTIAQKMDVLSSQANLGGYVAVCLAAERSKKIFPMMMTPSGTIKPSRAFIIGVGVAGLQAIATAKRLGARVDAFDTRPVVEEQVKSLGAKFLKVDLGDTGQTKDGYAKALTEEQLQIQRDAMAKQCALSDIVITTAQVFGRKAPQILTKEMVAQMKPGSIIVDMAVESGGNVEGSKAGEEVDVGGVRILGMTNLPGRVPVNSSEMFSANLTNFVEHFWDKENNCLALNQEDEIIAGALITHKNEIVHERFKG